MKTIKYIPPQTTKVIAVERTSLLVLSVQTPEGNITVDEDNGIDPGDALSKSFSVWDEE
ncbi:MAG: hypothetical protein IJM81_03845 [Prevotella sp.]|nr:hypothetical protein [Prevotella sp.]